MRRLSRILKIILCLPMYLFISPGEAVLAQYRGVSLPGPGGFVQQPSQQPSLATIRSRPTSSIPVYQGGGGQLDEGLNVEDITRAGLIPDIEALIGRDWGDWWAQMTGEAAQPGVMAAGGGAMVPVGTALSPIGASVGGALVAGAATLGIAGLSGLLDGVDAGAGMGLFGVDWGDIFGLGQGDVAELTGSKVVQSWNTGTAKFYRTQDGKIHTFTKKGVLKSWRPAKHIVVSKNPRMKTMIRANNRLDKLMKGVAKAVSKHLPKRTVYGQLPSKMLSAVERKAIKA